MIEARRASYAWQDKPLIRDFSTRIMRGDRVGLIGPNGSAKHHFAQSATGTPATGYRREVRLGTKLEVAYFDQLRDQLDPERTVLDNVAGVVSFIEINGQRRRHRLSGRFSFTASGCARRSNRCPAVSATGCCWPGCSASRPTYWSWTANQRSGSGNAGTAGGTAAGVHRYPAAGQSRPHLLDNVVTSCWCSKAMDASANMSAVIATGYVNDLLRREPAPAVKPKPCCLCPRRNRQTRRVRQS